MESFGKQTSPGANSQIRTEDATTQQLTPRERSSLEAKDHSAGASLFSLLETRGILDHFD
jgi:hypothetical protein